MYDENTKNIIIEGNEGYKKAQNFMKMMMPSHVKKIKKYRGKVPLFIEEGIEQKLNQIFESELKLLFLGRLDWGPNKDGLIWFLDNVWSKVESYNHKLVIAGSGNSEWLEAYEDYDNIEFLGFTLELGTLQTFIPPNAPMDSHLPIHLMHPASALPWNFIHSHKPS